MKTYYQIKPGLFKRTSLALGFFDGMHPGHQAVLKTAVEQAKLLKAIPALVTFIEHPRSLTSDNPPLLLTLLEQRLEVASWLGIEAVLLLSFTAELCRLSPQDYVKQVLVECMGACACSIGFNHGFGRNREGTPQLLKELGKTKGFTVQVSDEVLLDNIPISSSRIRQALMNRDVLLAKKLLARPYALSGKVVQGDGRGKNIGFPTANLLTSNQQLLPGNGVYVGICTLESGTNHACVINIGTRPTFIDNDKTIVEVHILDFSDEIYDKVLKVEFWDFLREEKKFSGVQELCQQINQDCQNARKILTSENAFSKSTFVPFE